MPISETPDVILGAKQFPEPARSPAIVSPSDSTAQIITPPPAALPVNIDSYRKRPSYKKGDTSNPVDGEIGVPRGSVIDDSTHKIVDFGPEIGVVAIPNTLSDEDTNELAHHIHAEFHSQRGK